MRARPLFLVFVALAGCSPAIAEVYGWRPEAAASGPALPLGTRVQVIDISNDPSMLYEDARAQLPPNDLVGRFRAIHRAGTAVGPVFHEIRGFAREHGADTAIVTCGPQQVDGREALVCAGMLVRTHVE